MARDSRLTLSKGRGPRIARRHIIKPFAPFLAEPKARASQQTELVYGQGFDVYALKGAWSYGRARSLVPGSRRKGYVGFVSTKALGEFSGRPTHLVDVISAPVFVSPDLKSHIVMSLPMGARIRVMAMQDGYAQIASGAYISGLHVRALSAPAPQLVDVARRYLGQPYIWGGNGARGVDCSGLLQMSLSLCGIDAPRDADLQEKALGTFVTAPEQAGDLLFWPGHVGIMATTTRLLHANATHMAVVEEPLKPALKRMERAGVVLRSVKRLS